MHRTAYTSPPIRDCIADHRRWLRSGDLATEAVNGWPNNVYGPSPIKWNDNHALPIEATKEYIETVKKAWVAAVKRSVAIGFDVIEIHNAHVSPPGAARVSHQPSLI